jgi:hypothetical protein
MSAVGSDPRTSITVSTPVEVPPARAFSFFTEEIGNWWDPGHHLINPFATSLA